MTFTIRTRGDVDGLIEHEYLCPVHGRFTRSVSRASAPDSVVCGRITGLPWLVAKVCMLDSPWSPSSAPCVSIPVVSAVSHAKDDARPHAGYLSTRDIAEGRSVADWKRERDAYWESQRRSDVMEVKK
jgi:hypothetical protein